MSSLKACLNNIRNGVYSNSVEKFRSIFELDIAQFNKFLTENNAESIQSSGEKMALRLFKEASRGVPAYKQFLKENGIDIESIREFKSFLSLPVISKKNYLTKWEPSELVWDGELSNLPLVSVSSGSTGEPFFWSRGFGLEYETTLEHELFLKYIFKIDERKTLFLIAYAMGMYVAGVFTLNSLMRLTQKGYPITVLCPGADKETIFKIVQNLGQSYDQVIIAAYPPLLKDIIDGGIEQGIDWRKYNLKFISGGESFSEDFRKYIYDRVGNKSYLTGSMNTYGSADAAILGHETPLSILIRLLASRNPKLAKALFGEERIPSLEQYYPIFKYFESIDGELVFSTYGGIPLVRYSIGDNGGIISFEKVMLILKDFNIDLKLEMNKLRYSGSIWKLPFVYLYGRKDNTKIFYGANIYPEHIKNCLEQNQIIAMVSGKYFMDIISDEHHNQSFYLAIELGPNIETSEKLAETICNIIHKNLLKVNAEYKYLSEKMGHVIFPKAELFSQGDPKYFSPRIKPRYIRNH